MMILQKQKWHTLEQDSPRKVEKKGSPNKSKEKQQKKSPPKKKNWYETNNSFNYSKEKSFSPTRFGKSTLNDPQDGGNPGKMIEEQKKKAFLQKKSNMLKNF